MDMTAALAHVDGSPLFSRDTCICCEHPVSAQSVAARDAAKADHVAYVNQHLSKADDPHFEEARLDGLVTL